MLSEGYGYVRGNLARAWETKTIDTKNGPKTVHKNSLAYQADKDADTIWVDLTVWPDKEGSIAEGEAVAAATGKGTRVICRGTLSQRSWKGKDGQAKTGWSMSVWDTATIIRPPRRQERSGQLQPQPVGVLYEDQEPF